MNIFLKHGSYFKNKKYKFDYLLKQIIFMPIERGLIKVPSLFDFIMLHNYFHNFMILYKK